MTPLGQKKLIIFDLDGTLAPSKQAMDPETWRLLSELLKLLKVAVISGGGYPQFQNQFLHSVSPGTETLSNLFLLPTSGTRLYAWQGDWTEKYREDLTPEEKKRIIAELDMARRACGLEDPAKTYGDTIEDRGSQITFSGLGQSAPLDLKKVWDPSKEKRTKLVDMLKPRLPEFDVRIGGTTSVDITRRAINKAYGIHKLEQFLNIPIADMLFVGDALFYGGNDYPVKAAGVDCIQVSGPDETRELIRSWFQ